MNIYIKRFAPLCLFLAIIIGVYTSGVLDFVSLESIKEHRQTLLDYVELHPWLSALAFMIIYILTVSLSLPIASLLTLLGGFLFGIGFGTTIIVTSATIGAIIIFSIAKSAVGDSLRQKAGPFYNKVATNMNENSFQYMLFTRFVPVIPFFIANILPALFDIKVRNFALATFIGIIPGTLVYANLGRELGTIESLGDLISFRTLGAFALLGVFALVPTFIKMLRKASR